MTGVLIVAHGSRAQGQQPEMDALCAQVQAALGLEHVVAAYLELGAPSMETGVQELIACGVESINIIPCFLFCGTHMREGFPKRLDVLRKRYPHVALQLGRPLGADRRLAEVLADRVRELLPESDEPATV